MIYGADLPDSNVSSDWLKKGSSSRGFWDELVRKERIGLGGVTDKDPWWKPMRELVIEVKPVLDKLTLARDDIQVTTLRKLDVVLWMKAHKQLSRLALASAVIDS